MKKFERLPLQQRKEEIQTAALKLFNAKGFAGTTMENIVEEVSLSKGGVYRIYPSTAAILSDLMISGMRLRNAYYEQCAAKLIKKGESLNLRHIVEMIGDSMLLYPEISSVYVEFLWEKHRNLELESVYHEICDKSIEETIELIKKCGAEELILSDKKRMEELTELMNATILSLKVLNLNEFYNDNKDKIYTAISNILSI